MPGKRKLVLDMKSTLKPKKYVINRRGKKVGVVLDIEDYKKMLADLEELESIRAYDAAKDSGDETVPFLKATQEIERSRK
jgi:PHD/YefM family antitoxin component YafN of YafNO toxin-antitoxin module